MAHRSRIAHHAGLAVAVLLAVLVASAVLTSSPAVADAPFSWQTAGAIGTMSGPGPDATACATTSFCAAVVGSTFVVSEHPFAGSQTWQPAAAPPTDSILSLACPSSTVCVATSADGDVLRYSDAEGGAGSWTTIDVDGDTPMGPIACASSSLCVTGDAQGNVLTISGVDTGDTTVQTGFVDDSQNYECIHYDETGPECAVGETGIACPSATRCVIVDPSQGRFSSDDPAGGSSTWSGVADTEGYSEGFQGLACPSLDVCVTADAYGGDAVLLSSDLAVQFVPVSADDAFFGAACASTRTCFLFDSGAPGIWASSDLRRSWHVDDTHASADTMACPSAARCAAIDDHGRLLIGRAYAVATVDGALHSLLAALERTTRRRLRRDGGVRLRFTAPYTGRLRIVLDAAGRRQTTLAMFTGTSWTPGRAVAFRLALTRAGARRLRGLRHLALITRVSFAAADEPPVTLRARCRLRP